ncbi:MAG: diguanylate cyclase [Oscillospiraceae bacterium]|nr:diguanylate cyclase [Oscillospiraceae bacterium]
MSIEKNTENPKIKILIADDEKIYTGILEYILSTAYDVSVVENGEAALFVASETLPDIVILDMNLPDIQGFALLEQFKENDLTKEIPLICMTMSNNVKDEEKAFALGAADYVTKPFVNSIMLARIRTQAQSVRQIRALQRAGINDSLTNLPNRRGFDERLAVEWERAVREGTPISLLFMDMDDFKAYNDAYGHTFGDLLIQTAGRIYKAALQRATDFVARWGGDEFAVLLPGTDSNGACEIASKILHNMRNSRISWIDGVEVCATVSIGVNTAFPSRGDAPAAFVDAADRALYAAKERGRDGFWCAL